MPHKNQFIISTLNIVFLFGRKSNVLRGFAKNFIQNVKFILFIYESIENILYYRGVCGENLNFVKSKEIKAAVSGQVFIAG